jgi:flavin reductase (DIM6/NTAB) family NADH-FMN oxidoreductase RutF
MKDLVMAAGGMSSKNHPDKLSLCKISTQAAAQTGVPFVNGCIAQLECRVLPATAHVAGPHDLILAEVIGAWADERVFNQGRWHFENAPPELRSLHPVAGGHFYAIGEAVQALPVVNA